MLEIILNYAYECLGERSPGVPYLHNKRTDVLSRIKSSNCPFCERETYSRPFGPRTVLSLTEWTVFGLSPLYK
jgi:hypothetical protein